MKFRQDYNLDKAIQVAQIEDKVIFIDTYAPWCGPCKIMDINLKDKNLGAFFNKHFINVRIDMDGPYGQDLREKYSVFFLPTILILDKHGNPKYVTEGLLSSEELLSIGSYHHNVIYDPAALMNSTVSSDIATYKARKEVDADPFGHKGTFENPFESSENDAKPKELALESKRSSEFIPDAASAPNQELPETPKETILYTANDQSKSPDYLYNYTYLKLQLQDGTHWAAAKKYLNTQSDWSTQKNMRFIFEFVRSSNSKEFQHIIDNREKYNEIFTKEIVDKSIEILVNQDLYQRHPRPTKDEVLKLFSYKQDENAEKHSYGYLLKRFEEEENYQEYVTIAYQYLTKYDDKNISLIRNIALFYEDSNQDVPLEEVIEYTKAAIEKQGDTSHELYDALANLYFVAKNKRKAILTIKKARELAIQNNADTYSIDNLYRRIKEL